jgi:hypothetical protein
VDIPCEQIVITYNGKNGNTVTYWFFHGDTRIWLEPELNGAVNSWENQQTKCALFHSYVTLLEGKRWWSPWLSHQLFGYTHVGYIIKYPHEKSPCRHLSPLRKTCFNSTGIPWNQHPVWCVFTILNPSNPIEIPFLLPCFPWNPIKSPGNRGITVKSHLHVHLLRRQPCVQFIAAFQQDARPADRRYLRQKYVDK